jgi:MYXO-CTERM domain-containing protein
LSIFYVSAKLTYQHTIMKKATTLLSLLAVGGALAFTTPAFAQSGDANGSTTTTETSSNRGDDNDDHGKWGLAGLLGLLGLLGRKRQDNHVHTTNNPNVNR